MCYTDTTYDHVYVIAILFQKSLVKTAKQFQPVIKPSGS